jgi:hypothetical protein
MKTFIERVAAATIVCAGIMATAVYADDATTKLFELLDSGGCVPGSLTGQSWTITVVNGQTHGELVAGDVLEFISQESSSGVSATTDFTIERNSIAWTSTDGWVGQCVSDGATSRYVVDGQIDIDGCTHEFACSRLESMHQGTELIEFVMTEVGCGMRNPGSADGGGTNNP